MRFRAHMQISLINIRSEVRNSLGLLVYVNASNHWYSFLPTRPIRPIRSTWKPFHFFQTMIG